jgi:thioesterase domain-containing protein
MDVFYCNPLVAEARNKKEWLEGPLREWERFSDSKVRFHDVPGSHYTMLAPQHLRTFQLALKKALIAMGL